MLKARRPPLKCDFSSGCRPWNDLWIRTNAAREDVRTEEATTSTTTTTSQSLPEFKIFQPAHVRWARRSPPARKLSPSPLPSLHSNGSPSGSPFSFYLVLVLHVRGIIFAKDAADDPGPRQTANAPENALSKEQKFGGLPQKIPEADEHATFGRDDVRLPIARLAAYAKPFVA